jgi:hypothetical protein
VLLAGAPAVGDAPAHIRKNNLWTARQAEVIRVVRGVRLYLVTCKGSGSRHKTFRHFACSGQTSRNSRSPRTALVTYVLHALGGYYGRRSGYFATNVRFSAFFVP